MPSQSRGEGPERQPYTKQLQDGYSGTPKHAVTSRVIGAASAPPGIREGYAQRAAKDVEGLKDYVCRVNCLSIHQLKNG